MFSVISASYVAPGVPTLGNPNALPVITELQQPYQPHRPSKAQMLATRALQSEAVISRPSPVAETSLSGSQSREVREVSQGDFDAGASSTDQPPPAYGPRQ